MTMLDIECLRGQDPVHLQDWTVDVDGELRGGVAFTVDGDEEVIVDFSPDQARGFSKELVAAADRADKAALR